MAESFKEFEKKKKDEDKFGTSDLNLDDMLAEISAFDLGLDEEESDKETKEKYNDAEKFNEAFDKELDDRFVISRQIDMVAKPNISKPPEIPEIPHFPAMEDIEKLLDGKVPEVPDHFTIEVPPEFEEIVPPEPLGDPPPPPELSPE